MADQGATAAPGPSASTLKWRLLFLFWLIQAPVIHLFLALWFLAVLGERNPFRADLDDLLDPGMHALAGTLTFAISILQAALVLPIHRPAPTNSRRSRIAKALIGGLACGLILAAIAILTSALLDHITGGGFSERFAPPEGRLFWITVALGSSIATPILLFRFRDRVPLALSMTIAAMLAATIAGGIACILASILDLLGLSGDPLFSPIFVVMALSWIVATPLLIVFARSRDPESALARIASLLFIGTGIELLATIPVDVMVRRKTDCYCAEGTFWSLGFVAGVGALIAGPAIFLLPLAKRRRRAIDGKCTVCGYDLTGLAKVERCPECGSGWKPRV